jgi:hypothetical protein
VDKTSSFRVKFKPNLLIIEQVLLVDNSFLTLFDIAVSLQDNAKKKTYKRFTDEKKKSDEVEDSQ